MRVFVVEDNPGAAEGVVEMLQGQLDAPEVSWFSSVFDFRVALSDSDLEPPEVVILDIMLPGARLELAAEMPSQFEVAQHAGLDCAVLLRQQERWDSCQIVFYSILAQHSVRNHDGAGLGQYVQKGTDGLSELAEIVLAIRDAAAS